jgi:hypothetical protein
LELKRVTKALKEFEEEREKTINSNVKKMI